MTFSDYVLQHRPSGIFVYRRVELCPAITETQFWNATEMKWDVLSPNVKPTGPIVELSYKATWAEPMTDSALNDPIESLHVQLEFCQSPLGNLTLYEHEDLWWIDT